MADYNVNMKQWNGTSFDNVLPLAYNALKVGGKTYDEIVGFVNSLVGIGGYNARIAFGSYTGTGATGATNPNTLQFDFHPVLVFIGDTKATSAPRNPTVFLRDRIKVCADPAGGNGLLVATWSDNALSWYCRSDNAYYQLNGSGELYRYAVIGYDKAKEEA